jgi:nucleoside transporter
MFLQYAVWGAWISLLPNYLQASRAQGGLGFTAGQIGLVIGLAAGIGAVTAPFIAGQLADRNFSTERFLFVLLFAGGIVKWITAYQTTFGAWMALSIIFSIVYVPTLSLVNSLSFTHLPDSQRDFPYIRVWGTIGFIAGMWTFPMIYLQRNLKFQWLPPFLAGEQIPNATPVIVRSLEYAGIIAIVYALYCLTLPHTPPKKDAKEKLAFAKAFKLFRKPSFSLLIAITVPIAILHYIYWMQVGAFLVWVGMKYSNIPPAVSVGQFAEIFFMVSLGLVLKRMGSRWVITLGCFAYGFRFVLFAAHGPMPLWVIVLSQSLHGICAAAFFAASFIYVDRIADTDVRHSAQTIFAIILFGIGPILAGQCFPLVEKMATLESGALSYGRFWAILAALGLATTVVFGILFRDESEPKKAVEAQAA